MTGLPTDVASLRDGLSTFGYLADDGLATALFLAVRMGQPLLLEGEPGVGKTEAAKALAALIDTPLVRLQCYEGLTAAEALYEWNYPRQLLAIRLAESRGASIEEADLFGPEFLLPRPLLAAIDHPGPRPAVLLIDEVDRADDEFEAFLFELLAEGSVTIPELGTRRATVRPVAILTSNRTRTCTTRLPSLPLPLDPLSWADRVADIIRRRVPEASVVLAERIATTIERMRGLDLYKAPGVAEAISWASALEALGVSTWDTAAAQATLGAVLKYDEDLLAARSGAVLSDG
jgi:MoxR-like ATPase